MAQISHIHKNYYFLSIIGTFLDQPLIYKFHGSNMWGMYFCIFASCEPLIRINITGTKIHDTIKYMV